MADLLACPVCQGMHRVDDVETFTCQRCTVGYSVIPHCCSHPVYRIRTCGHVVDGAKVVLHVERVYVEKASWRTPRSVNGAS